MSPLKSRDPSYDVVKALLMCLIVIGHLSNYIQPCSWSLRISVLLSNFILGVSMPCFFVISGYFSGSTLERGLASSAARFLSILWPAMAIGWIFGVWDYFTGPRGLFWFSVYPYFFLTRDLWFLRILLVIYAVSALVFRFFRQTPARLAAFLVLYLLFVFDLDPLHGLFRVEEVKHMMPYFVFGLMVLRRHRLQESRWAAIACGIVFLAVIVFEGNAWEPGSKMNFYMVPDGWRNLLGGTGALFLAARTAVGLTGSVALIWCVRQLIGKFPAAARLSAFGTTTLGVYIMHEWVFKNFFPCIAFPVPLFATGCVSFLAFHYLVILMRRTAVGRNLFFGEGPLARLRALDGREGIKMV